MSTFKVECHEGRHYVTDTVSPVETYIIVTDIECENKEAAERLAHALNCCVEAGVEKGLKLAGEVCLEEIKNIREKQIESIYNK